MTDIDVVKIELEEVMNEYVPQPMQFMAFKKQEYVSHASHCYCRFPNFANLVK